ncbi:hypothetical protein CEXT_549731 [Caerostris extrusa]|uniref:Uncharacterized protein n=1 Tax=Caerostris extrusa TaxID=172846 RepID=A0AAV4P6Q9_CAEEX|nr:hypothetical protein CEXT_549731 [Caerostris extrusa]
MLGQGRLPYDGSRTSALCWVKDVCPMMGQGMLGQGRLPYDGSRTSAPMMGQGQCLYLEFSKVHLHKNGVLQLKRFPSPFITTSRHPE